MNRVFKVIWNKSRCCFSVVSEIAKNHKKAKAVVKKTSVLFVTAFLLGSTGVAHAENPAASLTPAEQAVYNAVLQELAKNGVHYVSVKGTSNDSDSNFNNDGAKKTGGIAIGEKAKSESWSAIAIGSEASSAGGWDVVIGKKAISTSKQLGTAIGYQASVSGDRGIALGANTNVSGQTGIAIGGEAKSTGSRAIAIAEKAESSGDWGMAIGADAKNTAQLGMAIGYATKVEAAQGLALGVQAKVTKVRGIGIGTNANVSGEDGISFGSQTSASGQDAISIGTSASSSAKRGIAVGKESNVAATAARGIAIGDGAYVGPVTDTHTGTAMPKPGDEWKPVMPFQPTDDDTNPAAHNKTAQENSLAIGMRAGAFGYQNVAIGAAAEAHDTNSTALGVAAVARGNHSTALGKQARTYGQETTSVGHWADTRDEFATALGAKSIAFKKGATALGSNALAYDENSVAIGANSIAKEAIDGKALYTNEEVKASSGIVSVGNPAYKVGDTTEVKANYRRIVNVAGGISDHDAVNVAQLKALNKKIDGKKDIHFFSSNGSDSGINYDNQGARAGYTTAVGPDAMATEENSQAFGYRARAIGHSSIVFGVESTASGARDIAIGYGSHAVGSDNTNTSWNDTIAIGWNALSRGGSFASGSGAVAGGSGSVALGFGAYVGTKWLDDETQKAQNVNKWVLTRSFLDNGLRDELKAKFPEKFAEWERRAKSMPAAMGSDYLEQKLRTLAMEQLPQMTSPSMKNTMKDMDSSIAIGHGARVYSASAIAIGSKAKVGENLDDAIALGNQSLATRNAGGFGYDPTSDATTWEAFKKVHPEVGVGAAREQDITRELNNIEVEMKKMGNEYAAWIDKEKHYDNYKEERKAYAEAHGSTLDSNNEWVEWVVHVRNEQQKLRNKGQVLYDKFSALQKELNSGKGAWVGGKAALAIGNEEAGVTRQITGVAAGTKDTDAVNVAQLKVLNTKVDKVAANSTAYTVETKENNDNTTTVTIKSNKAGDKGTTVTVATKDIHITSGTYDKNTKKLTFTTNTNTTFDVDMNDVINAAAEGSVHYLSVNSSEQGAGSNYKNDGAKAKDSIVLGVRSSSEGINGVVVGNDNKLTGTKNNQNNSVVMGYGLNVDGVHNIVVGTDYENYDRKETKVKGEQNTVIGNGNLVGYTAVKDPNDDTKWMYTEVGTSGSDSNVVVGSCNTANGSSVAVGTDLEVEDLGRSFGSGNKIIGSNNGGGQWGLALGSNNTVKGEMSVSVGTETNASGDYTISIGSKAKTSASQSIAMGYQAETVKGWSAAIGSGAKTEGTASTAVGGFSTSATVDYGAAFGSFSVAQRASGEVGYLANGQTDSVWKSNLGAFSVGNDVKGYSRQITGVAAGTKDTDAVNVAQLKAIENKIGTGGTNGKDGKSAYEIWRDYEENGTQPNKGKDEKAFLDSLKGKDGTGADIDIKGDTESGVSVKPTTDNAGKKTYTIGLGETIKAGKVTIDGTKDKENVAVGDVKINGEKGKGTITGLSNKTWDPNKIESGRAATEDQLKAATQGMADISGEINHVGAHSAALAALHPLDFDPDEKLDIAAGVGNYNGSNAVALGAYYRPNESTMISVGGSFGSGKNMVNAGVSVKVGQGNNVSRSRIAMAKEIKDMRAELETLRKAVAGISQGEKVDSIKMKLFPDVPENHWAYEYVKELVKQGVIDGYPDGTFKGDRMMTRYEFAAIFYKAMQKGINVNKKILDEFEVELERFRIDVIAKDKNGNPTIERIRVN